MRLFHVLTLLLLAVLSPRAQATTIAIEGNSTSMNNCIPFGANHNRPSSTTSYYAGWVYQNVPAFNLQPGDTIAFDLGAQNDFTIVADVALAAASSNGATSESRSAAAMRRRCQRRLPHADSSAQARFIQRCRSTSQV